MTANLTSIVNISQLDDAINDVYTSFPDGTTENPGMAFENDKTTGITRNSDGSMSLVVKGNSILTTGTTSLSFEVSTLGNNIDLSTKLKEIVSVTDFGVVNDPDGSNISANTTAYNNALTTCSGVARLHHPENISVVLDPITISKPICLVLDGQIKLAPNSNKYIINLESSDVTITGFGTLDGNISNQVGGVGTALAGITANTLSTSVSMPLPPANPISISNILIEGITIQNVFNWPISLGYISNSIVRNTTLCNSSGSPQFIFSAENCWFNNNHVYNIQDGGFVFYQGNNYCGAIGNIVHDNHDGIGVYCDNSNMASNENINIIGNIVYDNQDSGISVTTGGSSPTLMQQRVLIEGNVMRNNNVSGRDGGGSVGIVGGQGISVIGNNIFQDGYGTTTGNKSYSIYVDDASQFINIRNNIIGDVGALKSTTSGETTTVTGGGVAIFLSSPVNCSVVGNCIYDTQSTSGPTQTGIGGGFGAGCVFADNYLNGAINGYLDEVNKYSDTQVQNRSGDGKYAISLGLEVTSGDFIVAQGCISTSNYYGATAQGSTQATAQAFSQQNIVVNSADSGAGVLLSSSEPSGIMYSIFNRSGNSIVVYPPSGQTIEGLSENEGATLPNTYTMQIVRIGTGWYGTVAQSATSQMSG